MMKFDNLDLIKTLYIFIIDIYRYCNDLKKNKKKVFADKILNSSLITSYSIQYALYCDNKKDYLTAYKKALKELKKVLHRMELCDSISTFKAKEKLYKSGKEILEFCETEITKAQA